MKHEKSATGKDMQKKKVQHEKSPTGKKVQREKIIKRCTTKKVQDEKATI